MKIQWTLLVGLLFAIIVSAFAIVNVDSVPVNYIFGTTELPLILVILFSALLGAIISIFVAMFKALMTQHRIRELQKANNAKEITIADQQNEIAQLQKMVPPLTEDETIRDDPSG